MIDRINESWKRRFHNDYFEKTVCVECLTLLSNFLRTNNIEFYAVTERGMKRAA